MFIIMFLDDGFGTNTTLQYSVRDSDFVKDILAKAGFVININKSIWHPVQCLEWIVLVRNSKEFCISIPERGIKLLMCCWKSPIKLN